MLHLCLKATIRQGKLQQSKSSSAGTSEKGELLLPQQAGLKAQTLPRITSAPQRPWAVCLKTWAFQRLQSPETEQGNFLSLESLSAWCGEVLKRAVI